jgi:L-amino acid N-acyltransferase YncA
MTRVASTLRVRPATIDDAAGIARVLNGIVAEGGLTALDTPVSLEQERSFLAALGPRSSLLVAELDGRIVGFQGLDPAGTFAAMAHVAQLGSYVERPWRGHGIARRLWQRNREIGLERGFRKVIIQVRVRNTGALAFYRRLGFEDIGIAREHVVVDGHYEDEVLLEREL